MALVIADRVRETSTTTGTGTYTVAGAETGFRTFSSAIGNTNTTPYTTVMGSNWEVGIGTVGAGTLARTEILASSNGGSAVNWGAGTKQVACAVGAELLPLLQGGNIWESNQTVINPGGSGDVAIEVRTDGDHTPRINIRKQNVSSHTARIWQLRANTNGHFALRDDTSSADRIILDTSGRLLPGTDDAQDLGSGASRWKNAFFSATLGIEADENAEVHVDCVGDVQPSLHLQRRGVTSHTARDWKLRLNSDGQLALRDDTAGADRLIFGIGAAGIKPATDNAVSSGASGERWTAVYAVNGTIQTSDARDKRDIKDAELGLAFIQKLRPRRYRWRAGDDKREHYGLLAQEMVEALGGIEFGGIEQDLKHDRYGLNYSELVPVLIKANQELVEQVKSLEKRLATLELQMAALR